MCRRSTLRAHPCFQRNHEPAFRTPATDLGPCSAATVPSTSDNPKAKNMTAAHNLDQERAALSMIQPEPFNAEAPPEALAGEITPTRLHYVRSNLPLPEHDGTLEIGGAVAIPATLTLGDLRALPSAERVVTMECAGNGRLGQTPLPVGEPWGGYAVSAARWKGAFLHEVLTQARPAPYAIDVKFSGADHGRYHEFRDLTFMRSLALTHAADPAAEILIAYEMNGEPLTADHGAPFRLIVPDWYGVASVKWLKRIEVLAQHYAGEFQIGHYMYECADRRHEPVTTMRVRPGSTDPAPAAAIRAGTYTVRGKAWSGTGPVTHVHVSLTGEGDWHPANLEPQKGPYHWQGWSFDWTVTRPGRHTLRARATDAHGN